MKHRIIAPVLALMTVFGATGALASGYLSTTVVKLNSAPVAENMSFETYRGIAITESFRSVDPEGDQVTYSVTAEPRRGTVTVDGDRFTYTPAEGKKGKDTFKYVAVDELGSVSNEATVTVTVRKQKTEVTYSDMEGHPDRYAATWLAENGVFLGERVGAEYLFEPDRPVTRGEFLAMCLSACSERATVQVSRTGFADDEDIPAWQKPYVAAAVLDNIVTGSVTADGRTVFSANSPVTMAQAGVILNNTLGITDVAASEDEVCPVWARQADANLASVNIISSPLSSETVTRADAARLICAAARDYGAIKEKTGLLGWAK